MPARKKPASGRAASAAAAGQPATIAVSPQRELIVIAKPAVALRARKTALASAAGADVSSLARLLENEGVTMTPLFGPSEERVLGAVAKSPGAPVQEMARYYRVEAPDAQLDSLAKKLSKQPEVESAYVKPPTELPGLMSHAIPLPAEPPPATPDYASRQTYLDTAPAGIDARYAWTRPGGNGAGVRVIDIEGAWRFTHEDLTQNQGGVVGGTQYDGVDWRNHGTAVLGEFSGDRNTIGITGICPDANARAISHGSLGSAAAIRRAADLLGAGDIILLEMHRPGPRHNFQSRDDQLGYIAVEWWPDDYAAIVYATSRGILVVEAAGNGAENLDDALYNTRPAGFPATWVNPFRRTQDSGAIIVGAGAPPPGTHGRDHGPDRSRLGFSNFGSCTDTQGWGREVTTCGYGDLQGGSNEDLWYTDTFSGTSSASPIVTGALGCLQGALRTAGRPLLTPATARQLLRNTGSPQQDAPGRPATQRIGNRPDLRQAFAQLGLAKTGKETVKDKVETKENLKGEIKETKERKESKELLKEFKERKELVKEFKDKDKDLVEFFDRFGQLFGPAAAGQPAGVPPQSLEARVAALEQTIAQLAHFIGPELRPDLATSALSQEADLQSLSAQLRQQAQDAKNAKDQKDVEKLSET